MDTLTGALPPVNTLVYGATMSDRLTKPDWIRHGMLTLAREGPGALKAGPMAEALKVSRGSFYWHFADIADFRAQLLQAWRERATDQVIRDIEHTAEPDRLKHLMQRAFIGRRGLEPAIRAWAAQDKDVAAIVAEVDAKRVSYIAKLLVSVGIETQQARQRAAFVYWAYLGQALVMSRRHATIPATGMDAISALFES